MVMKCSFDLLDNELVDKLCVVECICSIVCELFYCEGICVIGVEQIVQDVGVIKFSLYCSYVFKDDLVVVYLCDYDVEFWVWFEQLVVVYLGDLKVQLFDYFCGLVECVVKLGYCGCGFINMVVEYFGIDYLVCKVLQVYKCKLCKWLIVMVEVMGVVLFEILVDGL